MIFLGITVSASAKITVKVGEIAPNFTLRGSDGRLHSLNQFRGQYVVLYFYPKDETPGCTTEACNFRDHISAITRDGAKVIGVSVQTVKSHKAFIKKYDLTFLLLADPQHKVVSEYGVYNKKWDMANRVTFLINPRGRIVKIYRDVDPKIHAKQVLEELATLRTKH
ncbi:MAG: peroxiredoxin [Bacteroidetes bacterium]|nr:peroxiredoxin [Bacteroidota bacterium]